MASMGWLGERWVMSNNLQIKCKIACVGEVRSYSRFITVDAGSQVLEVIYRRSHVPPFGSPTQSQIFRA